MLSLTLSYPIRHRRQEVICNTPRNHEGSHDNRNDLILVDGVTALFTMSN